MASDSRVLSAVGNAALNLVSGNPIGAASSFLGLLDSDDSDLKNRELMELQQQYTKDNMMLQHQLNSPKQYVQDLRDAGLSTAVALSQGHQMSQTSLGQTPSSDLGSVIQSHMLSAQLENIRSQSNLNNAQAQKTEEESKKLSAETQNELDTHEFYLLAKNEKLDLLDNENKKIVSEIAENDQSVKNMTMEYNLLDKDIEKVEQDILLIKANIDKVDKETALFELQKVIQKALADSQIQLNNQQISTLASQSYFFIQQGNLANAEAFNVEIQSQLNSAKIPFASKMAKQDYLNKVKEGVNISANSTNAWSGSRLNRAKASAQEIKNELEYRELPYQTWPQMDFMRAFWKNLSLLGGAGSVGSAVAR